jgi:ankyrin repeat protein
LRHLKDQAREMLKAGDSASLAEAQFRLARLYGFASWPKLKAHVESLEEAGLLKRAIDGNDLETVKSLMSRNPSLHRAPLGYGKDGPLTWVAECRVPWEPPGPARMAIAQWMIDNGSDVHQGGDGPLMRAALVGHRIPMMELLVANGADVNARWHGRFPIIFAPCETVDAQTLRWLLEHGADPVCGDHPGDEDLSPGTPGRGRDDHGTALDYVIGTYSRSAQLGECIEMLQAAGCRTRRGEPAVLAVLSGRMDRLVQLLESDPALAKRRFPDLDFGATAYRRLTLRGGTLLHVAAEYGNVAAARLLLEFGASVNARVELDGAGLGGQTPIFHAVSQFRDWGLGVAQLLVAHGADLTMRARLPGHYEQPGEIVDSAPLGYARRFPGTESQTLQFLRGAGAVE